MSRRAFGSLGENPGTTVLKRLGAGQLVTARFQPLGTTAANTNTVKAQLETRMASLGIFKTPEYVGWGKDDNNGLFVFKAEMKTGQFTAQEVANKIKAAMPGLDAALGAKRLNFLTIRHPTPNGEVVPAAVPDAPVTPGGGSDGGGGGGGAQEEEEGFFTRKIGPVPVWAIGAGVLVLGAGLVLVATRRRPAPAAMQANRRMTSNRRRALKPNDPRWEMEQYYRSPHGSALMRFQRTRNREEAAYRMWEELTRSFTDERGVTHVQSPDDRRAAYDLVREAYPDVDLGFPRPGGLTRNPVYALPERKAYPITSRKDAYHATQRLKQGRVRDEADAKRIIAAIKRTHHDIWREYLEGYSVSKIMTSKRKGLTARRRA
jgi:hypothetical protein